MKMYPYKPLSSEVQEIRLVHLKPGREYEEIECSLVHASFPPSPEPFDIETALYDQTSNNDQFLLRSRRSFYRTELPEESSLLDRSSRRNREYPSVGVPSASTDDENEAFRHIRSLRRPYRRNRVDSFVPQSSILAMSASVEDENFTEQSQSLYSSDRGDGGSSSLIQPLASTKVENKYLARQSRFMHSSTRVDEKSSSSGQPSTSTRAVSAPISIPIYEALSYPVSRIDISLRI
jgi:hypothetical protein